MIETPAFTIELIAPRHAAALAAYLARNARRLRPWEPRRPEGYDTVAYQAARIPGDVADADAGRAYRFLAFAREEPARMAASIGLSNIVRGAFQAAHLGYSIDAALQGRGLASQAVAAVVAFGFERLHLHRVMANYHPTNDRSAKLLRRLGFTVEGFARDYLYVDGAWRDSLLSSKINPDPAYRP